MEIIGIFVTAAAFSLCAYGAVHETREKTALYSGLTLMDTNVHFQKYSNTVVCTISMVLFVRKMCTANPSWGQVQDTAEQTKT